MARASCRPTWAAGVFRRPKTLPAGAGARRAELGLFGAVVPGHVGYVGADGADHFAEGLGHVVDVVDVVEHGVDVAGPVSGLLVDTAARP